MKVSFFNNKRTGAARAFCFIQIIWLLILSFFVNSVAFSQSSDDALIKRHIRRAFNERVLREEVSGPFFVSMCSPFWHFVTIEGKLLCRVGRVFDECTSEYKGALAKKLEEEKARGDTIPLCENEYSLQELVNYMNALVFTSRDFSSALAKKGEDTVLDEGALEGEDLGNILSANSKDALALNESGKTDLVTKNEAALGEEDASLNLKNRFSINGLGEKVKNTEGGSASWFEKGKRASGKNKSEEGAKARIAFASGKDGNEGKNNEGVYNKASKNKGTEDTFLSGKDTKDNPALLGSNKSEKSNESEESNKNNEGNYNYNYKEENTKNALESGKSFDADNKITKSTAGENGGLAKAIGRKDALSEGGLEGNKLEGKAGEEGFGNSTTEGLSDKGAQSEGANGELAKAEEEKEDYSKGEIFRTKGQEGIRVSVKGFGENFERRFFDEDMRLTKIEYWELKSIDENRITRSESLTYSAQGYVASRTIRTDDERVFSDYDEGGRLIQTRFYKKIELDKKDEKKTDKEFASNKTGEEKDDGGGENKTSSDKDGASNNIDGDKTGASDGKIGSSENKEGTFGNDEKTDGKVGLNKDGEREDALQPLLKENGEGDAKDKVATSGTLGGKEKSDKAIESESSKKDNSPSDKSSDKNNTKNVNKSEEGDNKSADEKGEKKDDKIIKFVLDRREKFEYVGKPFIETKTTKKKADKSPDDLEDKALKSSEGENTVAESEGGTLEPSAGSDKKGKTERDKTFDKVRAKEVTRYTYEEGSTKIHNKHTTREEFQYKVENGNPDTFYYEDGRLCIKTIYSEKTTYVETKYFDGGFTVESHFIKGTHTKDIYYLNGSLWKEKSFLTEAGTKTSDNKATDLDGKNTLDTTAESTTNAPHDKGVVITKGEL